MEDHVKFFVDPKTKQIDLRFWFETMAGEVYRMAPTRHFYQLEADYFRRQHLCTGTRAKPHRRQDPHGPAYLYEDQHELPR